MTELDDLREQIPSAIADPGAFVPRAKERGTGDQYESVPQWAARAVGSLVWPLVAEARAEADMHRRTRLRVERVLDEALGAEEKDGTGEGLAADVRLAITRRDEEIDRLRRALAGHLFDGESLSTRDAIRIELIEQQHAELVRQRESRIAWALEADRLDQVTERATHLAGRVLSEFIQKGYPGGPSVRTGWVGADTVTAWRQELAELSRPSVSDQTPATPDGPTQLARSASRSNEEAGSVGASPWRCVARDGLLLQRCILASDHPLPHKAANGYTWPIGAAPASDVPGLNPDCTADEAACVHGQTADGPGFACVACDGAHLPHTCSRSRADAAATSCETCQRPRSIHVCRACSPDGASAGPGCINCRHTGWDQTPCLPPAADLTGLAAREDAR